MGAGNNITDTVRRRDAIPWNLDMEEKWASMNPLRFSNDICKDVNLGSKSPLKQHGW